MKIYVYKEIHGKYAFYEFRTLYNWKFSMSGNYTCKSRVEYNLDFSLGIF
jgi:hypothetical protein